MLKEEKQWILNDKHISLSLVKNLKNKKTWIIRFTINVINQFIMLIRELYFKILVIIILIKSRSFICCHIGW